jgi:hypothetical protein
VHALLELAIWLQAGGGCPIAAGSQQADLKTGCPRLVPSARAPRRPAVAVAVAVAVVRSAAVARVAVCSLAVTADWQKPVASLLVGGGGGAGCAVRCSVLRALASLAFLLARVASGQSSGAVAAAAAADHRSKTRVASYPRTGYWVLTEYWKLLTADHGLCRLLDCLATGWLLAAG